LALALAPLSGWLSTWSARRQLRACRPWPGVFHAVALPWASAHGAFLAASSRSERTITATDAAAATHRDPQCCRAPPERLMRQPTDQAVPRHPLAAAASTPLVGLADPTRQDCPARLKALPEHHQAELVEAGKCGQVGGREGSVGHVEVVRAEGVRTSIIGRPRPSAPHRRAATLDHAHEPATTPPPWITLTNPPLHRRLRRAPKATGPIGRWRGPALRSICIR
jgi:hypothetical protein